MKRPLALMFAFTMLALPIACGDDDDEDSDGGTGGAATGGSTAKGGSTTGGKAAGGTAGKATGGTPTMAGGGGDTGEAGAGPAPEGGTAGAGTEPSEGGAAGGGTVPAEGGTAGATDPPSEGGTAGAGELTFEDAVAAICAKEPGGDPCEVTEGCDVSKTTEWGGGICGDGVDADAEGLAAVICLAAADADSFICSDTAGITPSFDICTAEQCAYYIKCLELSEEDVADALPECVD